MKILRATATRHHHTENLSGEMRRYLPKGIQREGRAGTKTAIATATKGNVSQMIDPSQ